MKKPWFFALLLIAIAGSFLGGNWYSQRRQHAQEERRILYYIDPMNPTHTSDKPGIAPCGMKLEPVYADEASPLQGSPKAMTPAQPGTVRVSSEKQQLIGVQVGTVEARSETYTLRALGRVAPDENRVYRLIAATDGWISKVGESTTNSFVPKDQLMAQIDIYSNDFFTWQQRYLTELQYAGRLQKSSPQPAMGPPSTQEPPMQPPAMQQVPGQASAAHQHEGMSHQHEGMPPDAMSSPAEPQSLPVRTDLSKMSVAQYFANRARLELLNLGVGQTQLDNLVQTREYEKYVEVRSPVAGIVLARSVTPNQKIDRGTELFKVADLSRVWIVADIYSPEDQYVRPGMKARLSLPEARRSFEATVTEVPPAFDPASRSLKVRLEVDNPQNVLRPDMFVDVEFIVPLPPAITVPADAVLDSGLRKTVFIAVGNGIFEPRTVMTGWHFGNRVEILKGLAPGEQIVVSGNFLLDSESRMKMAASGMRGSDATTAPLGGMEPKLTETKAAATAPMGGMDAEQTEAKATVTDPVCGMVMERSKAESAGIKSERNGATYYFCSDECKQEFDKEPGRFQAQKNRQHPSHGDSPPLHNHQMAEEKSR